MTRQEQIEEMAVIGCVRNPQAHTAEECAKCDFKQGKCNAYRHAEKLYDAGYRKVDEFEECRKCPAWSGTDCTRNPYTEGCLDDKVNLKNEIKRLEKENEQLKAKLEKNPLAIKQKIMEEDDYELTEREQATLFLDRMESDVEILHDIVENLDELLGKGINDYIMGIDGVEGIKDMWERSAVREFAEKLKKCSYTDNCFTDGKWHRYVLVSNIDDLLKEYE